MRTREFFGPRAAGWNDRFAEDEPAYARAVAEMAIEPGATVLEAGCGAGRALSHLARAVGPSGFVVGFDVTPEMVDAARACAPGKSLLLADAAAIPLRGRACDAILAAGLVPHLPDPVSGLSALARVAADRATLAVFHPVGRAHLARKHGRPRRPDDPLDGRNLPGVLAAAGWTLRSLDDAEDRYLALATRAPH